MRCSDVVDEVCRTHEVADAPAGAVEVLPCRADGQGLGGDGRGEGCNAGERDEREAVVDLDSLSQSD